MSEKLIPLIAAFLLTSLLCVALGLPRPGRPPSFYGVIAALLFGFLLFFMGAGYQAAGH